jgi:hypothetical protein
MIIRSPFAGLLAGALLLPSLSAIAASRATSDLLPPHKRQATVDAADLLAHRPPPPPLPADLASPFNPVDFDKADPSEVPAAAPKTAPAAGGGTVVAQPTAPATDRQTLETLAAQITPSGVIMLRGAPRLIFANKPFEVGTRFTATYNNQDYELELVAIDRTTFTLRYRGEDVTRPIKPVR